MTTMLKSLFSLLAESEDTATPTTPTLAPRSPQKSRKRKHNEISTTSPLDKKVDVVVGGAKNTVKRSFEPHRGTLLSKSTYFLAEFSKDWERTSFAFPGEEPEIYERVELWMYGYGFLLPSDKTLDEDSANDNEWVSTQGSQEHGDAEVEEVGFTIKQPDGSISFHTAIPDRATTGSIGLDDDSQASAPLTPEGSPLHLPPTPLDSHTLTKIYALADRFGMVELCNKVISLLSERLGYDMETPIDALIFAFERYDNADNPLRRLLIDFTAHAAPIFDLERLARKGELDTDKLLPKLMFELVKSLAMVRGGNRDDRKAWERRFGEDEGSYHVLNLTHR